MKKLLKMVVATVVCASMLCIGMLDTGAEIQNPYSLVNLSD